MSRVSASEPRSAPPTRPVSGAWELALPRGRRLRLSGTPRVMGVVNITPDSFSDGGRFLDPERAVEHALRLVEEGAELLDLGAESTRPGGGVYGEGAREVSPEEEIDRLEPVLRQVRGATELPISVDTRKPEVAEMALAAGADLINDITALADPRMRRLAAQTGCPVILMHSRGKLAEMQRQIRYRDVVAEVRNELSVAAERARADGVAPDQIVLDPGIGFGKTRRHNLALLHRLDQLAELGRPILVGASRKSFIGEITGRPPGERLPGSLAAVARAAAAGAAIVRVHDVAETVDFLRVWEAIPGEGGGA